MRIFRWSTSNTLQNPWKNKMHKQWGLLGFLLAVNPECLHLVAPLLLSETSVSAFCSQLCNSFILCWYAGENCGYLSQPRFSWRQNTPRLVVLLCVSLKSFMLSLLEQNKKGFSKAGGFINLVSPTLSGHLTCTSKSGYCCCSSEQWLRRNS